MKVTKEMIGAAHDICLKKGDFVLSANLLERIFAAMLSKAESSDAGWAAYEDLRKESDEMVIDLREQLAAQAAVIEKMRDVLVGAEVLFACHCNDTTTANWLDNTREALAATADPSNVLVEQDAALLEKLANEYGTNAPWVLGKGYEHYLRELAEKIRNGESL
ncbi:MAG: hypothetical protein ACR2IJ_03540 [Fluviibacter sp.]